MSYHVVERHEVRKYIILSTGTLNSKRPRAVTYSYFLTEKMQSILEILL